MKKVLFLLIVTTTACGAPAPYIPSYGDRYEQDLSDAQQNKDCFIEPTDSLNYAQYCYLGAHAAEKYPRFFPEYALQEQTILGMLYAGVRGLMLSTYDWSLGWSSIMREGISVVCSHPKKESIVFRKNGKPLYQTLHYEMNRIFNFLKSHPHAIITVFIGDYARIDKITRDMKEIITKNNYNPLLTRSDWADAQSKGEWPTLGWMRKNNKRLVLFTQIYDEHADYTWPLKRYFWENVYGTVDENLICVEEKEDAKELDKKERGLVSFGCFGSTSFVTPGARNPLLCLDYDTAKRLTDGCQKKGFAQGKLINVYWGDHIIAGLAALRKEGKRTVCEYINELNKRAQK